MERLAVSSERIAVLVREEADGSVGIRRAWLERDTMRDHFAIGIDDIVGPVGIGDRAEIREVRSRRKLAGLCETLHRYVFARRLQEVLLRHR